MRLSHQQIWFLLYLAVAVPELIGEGTRTEWLVYVFKPLLTAVLLLGFWALTRNHRSFWQLAVTGAVSASLLGDVLLMFQGDVFFLLGLVAFFFAQAHYIGAFGSRAGWHKGYLNRHFVWIAPVPAYLVFFLWVLWGHLPAGLHLPVSLYAVALCTMMLAVLNLRERIAAPAWQLLLQGALLFVLSDSLLAYNKFVHAIPGARVLIMLTYILAQWFLVSGAVQTVFLSGPKRQKSRPDRQTT